MATTQALQSPSSNLGTDTTTGFPSDVFVTNKAMWSYDRTGAGPAFTIIMTPKVQANGNAGDAKQFQTDTAGFRMIRPRVIGVTAASAGVIVVAYSTTFNDTVGCKTLADSVTNNTTGKVVAPDGTQTSNVRVVQINPAIEWDPIYSDDGAPIKSFYVAQSGAAEVASMQLAVEITKVG